MSDNDLRKLQREVETNPDDELLKVKLFTTKTRISGQKFTSIWKIREKKTGLFNNGLITNQPYYQRDENRFFTKEGKEYHNMTEVYKYLKKALGKNLKGLTDRLKNCEIVEYQTLTIDTVVGDISEDLEKIELESLRSEKEEKKKHIEELERQEKILIAKARNELEQVSKKEQELSAKVKSKNEATV